MKINLHIDRLVLDGLPIEHRHGPLVQASVEAELSRLLATGGLAHGLMLGGAMPSVPAGNIQFSSNTNPGELGQQIARALHGGIGQ